ncbi:MAG TPA: DUF1028 domain-containing protein [Flavilitoribacter sp.]|nr:DUF1028 domain-containing protein [Flavilitoribacter sp.]HMQ89818.1 DUF1028 domain-containing protein [Flavilitoribacter sp.]
MRFLTWLFVGLSLFPVRSYSQKPYGDQPLAHTFSIVAIDETTGEMGVAVQSHWFATGTVVIWGEAGVGVIATQSFVNPAFGPEGLQLMKNGLSPREALDKMLSADEGREFRQVGILSAKGESAAFTGTNCIEPAGHIEGKGYAVQANLMSNDRIWPAMASAFEAGKGLPLAERLLAALDAAQAAGGDIRGKQSAALLVVGAEATGQSWVDRKIDLRVDDHPEPLKELRRLLMVHRAYDHMNRGDLAVEKGQVEEALREYGAAEAMFPDNLEMKYWHAVSLANAGRVQEALPIFKAVFRRDRNWKTLTPRLTKNGLLTVSEADLKRILGARK